MTLELRPNCEYCDKDLSPDAVDARICSYECPFCGHCVDTVLFHVCQNCGFVPCPIRTVTERRQGLSLAKRPASTERVYLSYEKDCFARIVRDIPPESR